MSATDVYLTTAELAERLRCSPRTIQDWRSDRVSPPFTRIRGRVLYKLSEVERWERELEKAQAS